MLISTEHRKVVLNLSNPRSVLDIIPKARTLEFKGRQLVAVPHGLDETRVLRNIGILAPSPILHYYDWPNVGKSPMNHQKLTAAFATLHPRNYILNEMGTSKTLSVLWAYDYLKKSGVVDACLVVAPLSTLERTWGDEIFSNFTGVDFTVLHGTSDRRIKRAKTDNSIYIINHDGLKSKATSEGVAEHVIKRYGPKRVLVIIDELAAYRNASSERWVTLNSIIKDVEWVWGMTGSPTPTAPTDAWAQCRMVTPWTVPRYFTHFRNRTMIRISGFKWEAKANHKELVMQAMSPAIRFSRAECIDLPPTTNRFEQVSLTPEQKSAYQLMLNKSKLELEGGEQIVALNEGVKLQKLVQIACGVIYSKDDQFIIPASPRLSLVKELVEQAGRKCIIFVPLSGALDLLAAELSKHYSAAIIDGSVSKAKRDEIFYSFQNRDDPHLILAQPAAMSHGLTLTRANTIIWYCPTNSNDIFLQANARIVRPSQRFNTFIIMIQGTYVEREMYKRLSRQAAMQGALLDAIQAERIA